MKKRILSVLLGCSLFFGTVFTNAVSIEFEDLEQSDKSISTDAGEATITYEELEEATAEENIVQNVDSPLATEIDYIDEDEECEAKNAISLYSESYELISIENWNTVPNVIKQQKLVDIEYLVGHYQFNYTGTSNRWREHGPLGTIDGIANKQWDSGYSHLPELVAYESGTYANSSGAYLDGSYNKDGFIYKAYLTIEYSNLPNQENYPITFIYGGEDGIPQNGISTKVSTLIESGIFEAADFGWIDVTDFVRENGYGWYYCCNLTLNASSTDACADWKLVLIEENEKLPVRMLKLRFGVLNETSNRWNSISIEGTNITTKKAGTVTGQFLYNISNLDGRGCGKVQISADNENTFKDVIAMNGLRQASSPLPGLKTRNTVPIQSKTNYVSKYYYTDRLGLLTTTPTNVKIVGSDVELLDIDGTTNFHNITLLNNQSKVTLRFNPYPYWLTVHIMGIASDIDVPEYTTIQESSGHNEYYATITGKTQNTSTLTDGIGLNNGQITVSIDKQLKILSTKAVFTDADGNKFPLTSDMYTINEENNTITYTFGKDANGKSMIGEFLTYEIETVALEADTPEGYKTVANNEVQVSGYLISNNYVTDYWMNKVAWDTSSVQISNPPKVLEATLKVNPNGGLYENSSNIKEITNLEHHTKIELSTPERKGYTFIEWELPSDTTATINNNKVTIGYEDVEVKANWKVNQYKITINPNGGTIDNKTDAIVKTLDYGTETEIPIPKRPGYVFVGWENSTPDVEITDNKITVSDKDTILTAKWVIDSFDVTYIDVTPDGKELGRQVLKKNYNSIVKGSDIGSDKSDNAYYIGYGLDSWTEATVTLDGATVYRTFEYKTVDMNSALQWNDNNDADGFRPSKYKLKLKQNGKVIDEVELPSDETNYTFPNLPKYDSNGNVYKYSFDVDASNRYQIDFDEDGNLIVEDYLPANFSVIIPKTIVMDGGTGNADYNVLVNGTFYYNDTLTVIPESSLILTDRSKISSMQADVLQQKTTFMKEDGVASGTTATGSISADRKLFAGSWSGNFNFNISFKMQN